MHDGKLHIFLNGALLRAQIKAKYVIKFRGKCNAPKKGRKIKVKKQTTTVDIAPVSLRRVNTIAIETLNASNSS